MVANSSPTIKSWRLCLLPPSNFWLELFSDLQSNAIFWVLRLGLMSPHSCPLALGYPALDSMWQGWSGLKKEERASETKKKQTILFRLLLPACLQANLEADSLTNRWVQLRPTNPGQISRTAQLSLVQMTVHKIVSLTDGYCFKSLCFGMTCYTALLQMSQGRIKEVF